MRKNESTNVVKRVLSTAGQAKKQVADADQDLFYDFCRSVSPQLRGTYLERYPPERVAEQLVGLFKLARVRKTKDLKVKIQDNGEGRSLLRSCMADQPFIVDTVRLLLSSVGASYVTGFNVVIPIERDGRGRLIGVGGKEGNLESLIQVDTYGIGSEDFETATERLRENLCLARSMVVDFREMTSAVESLSEQLHELAESLPKRKAGLRETAEMLDWLLTDNFVFMGISGLENDLGFESLGEPKRGAAAKADVWSEDSWGDMPVRVRKSSMESPVHRSGRIDEIRLDIPSGVSNGKAKKDNQIVIRGMFTYRAVTQASRHVPGLRRRLQSILDGDKALPGAWRYKGLANAFDSLPTEFLFTATQAETKEILERILDAESQQDVRVSVLQRSDKTTGFVLAALPRSEYNDELLQQMREHLVQSTGATYLDHGVFVGRYDTVLVHFFLTGSRPLSDEERDSLIQVFRSMGTPWAEKLRGSAAEALGEEYANELAERYAAAFDGEYTRRARMDQVLRDISMLDGLTEGQPVLVDLFQDEKERLNLRIYQWQRVLLSDIFPLLDHFGLVVIDQFTDLVQPAGSEELYIDTFRLAGASVAEPGEILERCDYLVEAVEAVFAGDMEDDGFNRLLLAAGLPWTDVDLVRAYYGYARQVGLHFKPVYIQEILLGNPELLCRVVELFYARFDPSVNGSRRKLVDIAKDAVEDGLRQVQDHDEDLILRRLYELVSATTRTNFYRRDKPEHYVSLKFDHDLISSLPSPRLKYEIYVHHAEMEGVHLRGGLVARGGIRWSDRDDFRTEVLGLVKTQMVKNVLIVPVGAKGGFFMKRTVEDYAARRKRADELYEVFIRGLLDVTDNIVKGETVAPDDVVPHDGRDPYLVVAADKGTAHLSDTANRISRAYGFWLDDAFASGGSIGYDHKKVGITARGAWECVHRHLAEAGLNPETDPFTCMAVGDPAGDVFGNGVVQYSQLRLIGAFNHLHVFIDPDPRDKKQHAELVRLFKEGKGWDHFDKKVLSRGGGIFDRRAKSVKLSPEIRQRLGTLKEELPPDTLIRLMLRLPVHLLWNGGIGTYVKASWESNQDADDPTNDNLRVNADELRARSVGEGGNLGFTQAARVEFALGGGSINTDAVDNSGGVDMSDHEVNLKILLAREVAEGRLNGAERDSMIRKLTKEIALQVLANNDVHALQVSLDRVRSQRDPFPFGRAIEWVGEQGGPSALELDLPLVDVLTRRAETRQGLARPELAVLSAHVKMLVGEHLDVADVSTIPGLQDMRLKYFPRYVQKRYGEQIEEHMLARQIGLTVALTRLVADMGAAFLPALLDQTDRSVCEIFTAWFRILNGLKLDSLRGQVLSGDAPLAARYQAWVQVTDAVTGLMANAMAADGDGIDEDHLASALQVLGRMGRHRGRQERASFRDDVSSLTSIGIGDTVAERVAAVTDITVASEIARVREANGDSLRDAIVRYLAIGNASRLLPAIRNMETRRGSGPWDEVAGGILRARYFSLLREVVLRTSLDAELKLGVDRASFRLGRGALKDVGRMVDHVLGDAPDVGALLVAEERLRAAIIRGS